MRLLILCKRQYTGKDLIDDRFGRLFEIPAALADRGHVVHGLSLSYRRRNEGTHRWPEHSGMAWDSVNALPAGIFRFPRKMARLASDLRPDLILASSDALHAAAGRWLSRRTGVPLVVDLYDNYESFGLSRIPGAVGSLRRACRHAIGVATVSEALAGWVRSAYGISAPVRVVGNGVRTDIFHARDRDESRRRLGLPESGVLVGTAGSLTADRGISDLLQAFEQFAPSNPDAWLVVAGPRDAALENFSHPRLLDMGVLAHEDVGYLYSALDVAVVCNRDSTFGRYCFPLKLSEMLACGTPVIAASVGDAAQLLAPWPESLYEPGDTRGLAGKLRMLAVEPQRSAKLCPPTWEDVAGSLVPWLESLVAESACG